MPRYEYVCPVCGHREDQVRQMFERDHAEGCPVSGCQGHLERDVVAGMRAHADMGYQVPLLSDAAGVHPDQIADAKRAFPHHEFAPDGRMIFRSHSQRERVLRDLGMHDRK